MIFLVFALSLAHLASRFLIFSLRLTWNDTCSAFVYSYFNFIWRMRIDCLILMTSFSWWRFTFWLFHAFSLTQTTLILLIWTFNSTRLLNCRLLNNCYQGHVVLMYIRLLFLYCLLFFSLLDFWRVSIEGTNLYFCCSLCWFKCRLC